MQRHAASSVGSVLFKVSLLILLAAALDGSGHAIAQDGGDPPTSEPAPTPTEDVAAPTRAYFQSYPIGEGATPFEALSPADQEGIMLAAERTDYGPDVHAAWSAFTHEAAEDAAVKAAAYQSGTNGLDEVGVGP